MYWKKIINLLPILLLLGCKPGHGQEPKGLCADPEFDRKVHSMLNYSVPVIGVEALRDSMDRYQIIDTREAGEYAVSHLPGARYAGYSDFDIESLDGLDRDRPVVVYCSVGYRSEKIGERLQEAGFKKVYNLYGSLFEWANRGYPLINTAGDSVRQVHTYNRKWSKWVEGEGLEKTW